MMRPTLFSWIRIWFVTLFAVSLVPSAWAQQEQINALAARMAASIVHSGDKKVVVLNFAEPDGWVIPLGIELADDFSVALAASSDKLQVEDRSRVKQMMEDNGLQPQNVNDPGIATWLATEMGMQVLILGRLDNDTERLNISVTSYNVKNGSGISLFKVTIPLTDKIKGLIPDALVGESHDNPAAPNGKCVFSGSLPCGPTPGYSAPKCIRCPPPDYSQEAKDQHAQGTVVLLVVVDENGKAEDIKVGRALPYGLTRQAIQAVQKWTFQPATGPDGKPLAVRQLLEVTFHLY